MIKLEDIASYIENGLNAMLEYPNLEFRIWTNAGEYKRALRDGNSVHCRIHGFLRVSNSANEENLLVMGTNGLSIEFCVPLKPPRTDSKQTEEELRESAAEHYPFLEMIVGIINSYFSSSKTFELGKFSVAFAAGVASPGTIDIYPGVGKAVPIEAYITLYYVESGTMSKDVKIYFDGQSVPFQTVSVGRSALISRDVDVRDLTSKGVASSSAFSIHMKFPSNSDPISKATVDFMLRGAPNTAHFVRVEWGDVQSAVYLMTIEKTNSAAEGIAIAGSSVDLIELLDNCETIDVPKRYKVLRFFMDGDEKTLSFEVASGLPFYAFVAGRASEMVEGTDLVTVELQPNDFEYDEDGERYFVYLIMDRAAEIRPFGKFFEVIQEGESVG